MYRLKSRTVNFATTPVTLTDDVVHGDFYSAGDAWRHAIGKFEGQADPFARGYMYALADHSVASSVPLVDPDHTLVWVSKIDEEN